MRGGDTLHVLLDRLLLQGRFIFILLQGRRKLISNYIALQRTQQVTKDLDAQRVTRLQTHA
jgi:hypothetical protein